ncbi:MAG TPA: GDP-mannose 4,6-dehydratase [Hyphomicrobiaceae bacterium]|nr:GDP-mannose 4,6-dehydratase [Hyphomicrobiaceae bacterium]
MTIQGKRFLIAGGASLIGSHLTAVLLESGAKEVVLFDNYSLGSPDLVQSLGKNPAVRSIKGDILKLNQVMDAMKDVDGVFLLAAFLTLPLAQSPAVGAEVNIMGTVNVLEAARILGNKKVVLAASIAVYGNNVHGPVDESTPFGSDEVTPAFGTYAASKLMGEHLGRLYAQKYGVGFSSVRFSTVYGENQHNRGVNALYILEAMQNVKAGRAPQIRDTGEEAHDFIHASDAARGMMAAMDKGRDGRSYNICTGRSTSVKEIVDTVLKEFGSTLKPEFVKDTRDARSTAHHELRISNARARDELGWSPRVTIPEGIHRLRTWMEA